MNLRVVITGTDTNVGKTVFAAALTHALRACYWKPIQAGLDQETDSEVIQKIGNIPKNRILPEAWKLKTPVSPHIASVIDGVKIDPEILYPPKINSPLIIEGAGGLFVPLTEHDLFIDLLERWQFPTILCARTSLGTINHSLLSLESMRSRNIRVLGIAFIGDPQPKTEKTIIEVGRVRYLGRLPRFDHLEPKILHKSFRKNFLKSPLWKNDYD
ncbi:dethiobiotin synthase [Candidatus Liberibacter sp.]|uniref:dethiobiotin synthase n=1 Tax=Candidatus Liberibacter sp. TaxID=34022 RepID=UPI0015F5F47F|nr:dethiobiotin synthase [Candidatus Liberibacter sp.]MBA5724132.1 ATP-dependent dethiobiotin synthetase BioD [Candidatus Liberibacter sp.]